ncbi:MAG: C4-dicarboxylate TRAP transporter large permease protein DctM [Alphaproteobacteria bacterium MarineAlpha3_Bin5]|nr:C4-dicarboxylate ABC transporter permease [Magnetovibrio sp.]PPR79027.1 MAG: C4-dicarboxylate TRAP transporter large permease protein DctM [Alphaproteobacteria bacterium MarineAlpha3_Bin5]
MEIFFLILLIVTMILALGAGYPVAFALPGSAIITIGLASFAGYFFDGHVEAYFAHGDPIQWLNAGVTNLRGIYWQAERDTLIAIPLFIFMGIMLERSKIAEDLLVTMGQLFGPIPGGVGISVVLVGALLAATTGIVGATVIAMGLISLPVMLRAKYSHSLATGTISASGTLGQIIPPSIVLIILADQLSNATDQGSAIRTADYKAGTGLSNLPTEYDLTSTSAGDMFLGAFLPGLVLVALYVSYILILSLLRPAVAPPAPFEGSIDRKFAFRVIGVLVPPLALIFIVLGSIIMGIATVNQAGAIGAVGSMIMAGYRLKSGQKDAFLPALLSVASIVALAFLLNNFVINVKAIKTSTDILVVILAATASFFFLVGVGWSAWRTYKIDKTLEGVMIETAKTTSLVFIILLGAAMLTAAFRAFGGEELVRNFLSGLPGGFISKFVVVMIVIFILGFFLDFIEIAVVVVPIIAPILLADPTANVTAVWFGVMIGVNMQTSFLTPPFGFALFYLRGVAPAIVRTIEMYKGVAPFIALQLLGLVIVGLYPPLVNYLPAKVYLTSETAPPPKNPRIQACLEEYLFEKLDRERAQIQNSISKIKGSNFSYLPQNYKSELSSSFVLAEKTFSFVDDVKEARKAIKDLLPEYKPFHSEVRDIRVGIGAIDRKLKKLHKNRRKLVELGTGDTGDLSELDQAIEQLEVEKIAYKDKIPENWQGIRETYTKFRDIERKARKKYRRNVDDSYEPVSKVLSILASTEELARLEPVIKGLEPTISGNDLALDKMNAIKTVESKVGTIAGASPIKSKLSAARRAIKKKKTEKAVKQFELGMEIFDKEILWRKQAKKQFEKVLIDYEKVIRSSIGVRSQERLTEIEAEEVASCQARHRDISLDF